MFSRSFFSPSYFSPSYFAMGEEAAVSLSASSSLSDGEVVPIGINQDEAGDVGDFYPFVDPSDDVLEIVADLWLAYEDDGQTLAGPFQVDWIYGFGAAAATVGITPVHDADMQISDADGNLVFSTLDADSFNEVVWGVNYTVYEWIKDETVLRAVVYNTPSVIPLYLEPASAVLDERAVYRYPPRLRSITVGLTTIQASRVRFQNGFNTEFTVGATETPDGGRRQTTVALAAEAGSGSGRFGPGCDETVSPVIRRINNVAADDRGNFLLSVVGRYADRENPSCYRLERPVTAVLSAQSDYYARELQVRDNTLLLRNDCAPCCDCDDFLAVWEALRRQSERNADLRTNALDVRDIYYSNRDRWITQIDCRNSNSLRAIGQPSCPGQQLITVGYCNNSLECISGLVLHLSFAYDDAVGDTIPGYGPPSAFTTAEYDGPVCDTTFRGGFVNSLGRTVDQATYQLGGDYPHYWAYFDFVSPGQMAYFTFRAQFNGATTAQIVEAIADAYAVGVNPVISGGSPVPGYTPGSGPDSTALGFRKVDNPVRIAMGLSPDCCTSTTPDT